MNDTRYQNESKTRFQARHSPIPITDLDFPKFGNTDSLLYTYKANFDQKLLH